MKIEATHKALRQQAGYTLIELSISVAIIAVLVMTGLYGVPRILATNKVTIATQQVALANANYSKTAMNSTDRAWATVTTNYVTNTASTYASMGLWPDQAVLRSGTGNSPYAIQHPFGGMVYSKVNTQAITGFLGIGEGYILKLDNVPANNCLALASAFGATAIKMAIDPAGGTGSMPLADDPIFTEVKAAGGQLNNATLATACSTNSTANKAIFMWFAF